MDYVRNRLANICLFVIIGLLWVALWLFDMLEDKEAWEEDDCADIGHRVGLDSAGETPDMKVPEEVNGEGLH